MNVPLDREESWDMCRTTTPLKQVNMVRHIGYSGNPTKGVYRATPAALEYDTTP